MNRSVSGYREFRLVRAVPFLRRSVRHRRALRRTHPPRPADLEQATRRAEYRKPQRDRRAERHPHRVTPSKGDRTVGLVAHAVAHDGDEDDVDEEDGRRDERGEERREERAERGAARRAGAPPEHEEREHEREEGESAGDWVQDEHGGERLANGVEVIVDAAGRGYEKGR